LADRLAAVLIDNTDETLALVTLNEVRDASRLGAWVQGAAQDVLLLDLSGTAEALVARYRNQALFALGLALAVIAVLMLWQLKWRTAVAVVLPVLATLAASVAVLHWTGAALTLFHVVALLLVGGLSFDYGLFFNRREASSREALQTRYAVTVCWLSTAGAFALLMLSAMPVLEAIGTTVTLGVTLGFVLALLGRESTLENVRHAD
jgi:predicted exporter